jgi:uncharacterized damage-inducible protein DinB
MAADRSYVAKNDAARQRLEKLVASCSDAELAEPMPAGWTVAAVLAHVAFWDVRIQLLLDRWQTQNVPPPAITEDFDWINDAAKPMQLALSPRRAAELTVASAQTVDRMVQGLSEEMLNRIIETKAPLSLDRAAHRNEHLDEIEAALRRR